jgi:hypothetical protein
LWLGQIKKRLMSESNLPEVYIQLCESLRRRREVIADRTWYERDAEGHLEELKSVSEKIVHLGSELPDPVHPQLRHFLERCSYDKALEFIEAGGK